MLRKKIKVALGIISGKVLTGPIEVSVDLTRKCTLDCLMCWWWSPLLRRQPSQEWANQEIDYELFEKLIQDFKKIQVKRIILGGQGEPLLYPRILEAIEMTKKAGIEVTLITCGAYFDEKIIRTIFDLGVDSLGVSIQAATAETYLKMHPGQKRETFEQIKDYLILLSKLKKTFNKTTPEVMLLHVICNLNYRETVKVAELAKEVGVDVIGFKRIDVVPETRVLLLNKEQLRELRDLLNETEKKAAELGIATTIDTYRKYIVRGVTTGVYTTDLYSRIPCYVGWHSARILSDGNIIPCCGGYDLVFGNIQHSSFIDIWNSDEYYKFRQQAISTKKGAVLRKRCKCYSCIDYGPNLGIYRMLHPIKARRISR